MNFVLENAVLVQVHTQCLAAAASIRLKPLTGVPPWRMPPAPSAGKPYGTLTLMDRLDSSAAKIEVAWYSGRTDNGDGTYTYTGLLRGQEGTTARQWEVGEWAMQAPTARALAMDTALTRHVGQFALKHRGTRAMTWDGTHFNFDAFTMRGVGRGLHWATNGYYNIVRPANATVINGYGGAANATVVAAGIPLPLDRALYYELPINAAGETAGAFKIVGLTSDFVVPAHWIMIAAASVYEADDAALRVGDGAWLAPWRAPTLLNSWANFGAGYATAGYFKDADQVVTLRGLVAGGTIAQNVFVLPTGYIPELHQMYPAATNTGLGEVRVLNTGAVVAQSGGNGYFSLNGIQFRAAQ